MNEYFSGLASDVPSAEPNEWSKMLMSAASTNNAWSAEQAQKQMDFQERMSNTAHQREIADLKAAGLNPVLSARLGGASTPSGASATADTSIVSSIVQLMDKMLDVQGTSAAAAYNASGGSDVTYGNGFSGSSASSYDGDYKYPQNFANPNNPSGVSNTVTADEVNSIPVIGKLLGKSGSGAVASFINGANGVSDYKGSKNDNFYQIGAKYYDVSQNFGRPENLKEKNQTILSNIQSALQTASAKMNGSYTKSSSSSKISGKLG